MINLEKFRNKLGKIDISNAENEGIISIERNPQKSLIGARTKYWCECIAEDKPDILFKRTLERNYEDYGEILGYEFACLLGIPCAEYDFAELDGEKGVITEDIVKEDEELIGGNEILKYVNAFHILPIQDYCLKYFEFRQKLVENVFLDQNQQKAYINDLISLYKESNFKSYKFDEFISSIDLNLISSDNFEFIVSMFDEHYEFLAILYEYSFVGYNSDKMTDEEKEKKARFDNYFKSRGKDISGWNKKRKVVVSNNLMDIWCLLDIYCELKGYSYANDTNVMQDLIKVFVYDMILNQGDRHISNWSIMLNNKTKEVRLAPLYDNSKICNLSSEKEKISQISVVINSLDKEQNLIKKERTKKNLEHLLSNGLDSKLMIDYDDNYERNNKFLMFEKLLGLSDDDTIEMIEEICNKFSQENILYIFNSIEQKSKVELPNEVKMIILKTIEINLNLMNSIMENRKERSRSI